MTPRTAAPRAAGDATEARRWREDAIAPGRLLRQAGRRAWRLLPAPLRRMTLGRELRRWMPVLPVLAGQLEETGAQVERAVVDVCRRFGAMAAESRSSVEQAHRLLRGDDRGSSGLQAAWTATGETLGTLLDRIVRDSEHAVTVVGRLSGLDQEMRGITRILDDVDKMAMSTHILALNAAIEASRCGDQGRAFAVVADQMRVVAQSTAETSETIRSILTRLVTEMTTVATELRALAASELEESKKSRAEVDQALVAIERADAEMRDHVTASASRSEALAGEIAAAVMGLQFQDAVSQRLGHVVEAIGRMQAALAGHVGEGTADDESLSHLAASYTMGAERATQARVTERTGVAEAGGDVELF